MCLPRMLNASALQWRSRGIYIGDASVQPPMHACARLSEIIVNATSSTPQLGILRNFTRGLGSMPSLLSKVMAIWYFYLYILIIMGVNLVKAIPSTYTNGRKLKKTLLCWSAWPNAYSCTWRLACVVHITRFVQKLWPFDFFIIIWNCSASFSETMTARAVKLSINICRHLNLCGYFDANDRVVVPDLPKIKSSCSIDLCRSYL